MANVLEPPPIQTPINQGPSMEPPPGFERIPPNQDRGLFTGPWIRWFNNLFQAVNNGGGGGGSAASYIDEYTLTADDTITSPAATPNDGDILTVFLTQSNGGGWDITYDAGPPSFNLCTVNDIDKRVGWVTVQQFVCRSDGNWWLTSILSRKP